jgi:hypothetical protein
MATDLVTGVPVSAISMEGWNSASKGSLPNRPCADSTPLRKPPTSADRPLISVPAAALRLPSPTPPGIGFVADGVPFPVHGVHAAGLRLQVDQRHDAEVADRRARGQRDLRHRRGERGVGGVTALLERLEAGARRVGAVGDGDRTVLPGRSAGLGPH